LKCTAAPLPTAARSTAGLPSENVPSVAIAASARSFLGSVSLRIPTASNGPSTGVGPGQWIAPLAAVGQSRSPVQGAQQQ
jgi:hypothetical protein